MTIEEKARAYDEALEKLKEHFTPTSDGIVPDNISREQIEDIFSELKESEEERIRKELIDYINRLTVTPNNIDRYNSWIAWLEKQVQSIIIPKDLKGTDPDGGVVGEKGEQGEQPTNKNFKERYENIAKSDWFKKTHNDISIGEEQPTEEEMVGMGGLGKMWSEQAIISRLDKIIELLQSAILPIPRETYVPPIIKNPLAPDPNTLGGWETTASTEGGEK